MDSAQDLYILFNTIRARMNFMNLTQRNEGSGINVHFPRKNENEDKPSRRLEAAENQVSSDHVKLIDTVGYQCKPLSGKEYAFIKEKNQLTLNMLIMFIGHSTVLVNDIIYTFGGYEGKYCFDSLLSLDLSTYVWKENLIDSESLKPVGRASASLTAINDGDMNGIVLIGGSGVSVGRDTMDDVWFYNIENNEWVKVKLQGEGPGAIYGHSAVYYGNMTLLVFGGTSGEHFYNVLYALSLSDGGSYGVWSKVNVKSNVEPSERYRHCCVLNNSKDKMYLIGGSKTQVEDTGIEIWEFDCDSLKWTEIKCHVSLDMKSLPCDRIGHTCVMLQDGRIFLFGGRGFNDRKLNDAYYFNPSLKTWSIEPKLSKVIKERDFHTSIVDPRTSSVYIFGGATNHISSKSKSGRCNDLYRFQLKLNPPSLLTLCAKRVQEIVCENIEPTSRAMKFIKNEQERSILKKTAVQEYLKDFIPANEIIFGVSTIHKDSLNFPLE